MYTDSRMLAKPQMNRGTRASAKKKARTREHRVSSRVSSKRAVGGELASSEPNFQAVSARLTRFFPEPRRGPVPTGRSRPSHLVKPSCNRYCGVAFHRNVPVRTDTHGSPRFRNFSLIVPRLGGSMPSNDEGRRLNIEIVQFLRENCHENSLSLLLTPVRLTRDHLRGASRCGFATTAIPV